MKTVLKKDKYFRKDEKRQPKWFFGIKI